MNLEKISNIRTELYKWASTEVGANQEERIEKKKFILWDEAHVIQLNAILTLMDAICDKGVQAIAPVAKVKSKVKRTQEEEWELFTKFVKEHPLATGCGWNDQKFRHIIRFNKELFKKSIIFRNFNIYVKPSTFQTALKKVKFWKKQDVRDINEYFNRRECQ